MSTGPRPQAQRRQSPSFAWAPDRARAQTCPPRFRKLALQAKDEACSTRMRLALQGGGLLCKGRRQDLTTIKRPQHPHKKVRVTNSSLALQSCKNISDLIFGGCLAGSTPVSLEGVSVLFSLSGSSYRVQGSCSSLVNFSASSVLVSTHSVAESKLELLGPPGINFRSNLVKVAKNLRKAHV